MEERAAKTPRRGGVGVLDENLPSQPRSLRSAAGLRDNLQTPLWGNINRYVPNFETASKKTPDSKAKFSVPAVDYSPQWTGRSSTRRIDEESRLRLKSDEWLVITGSILPSEPIHETCQLSCTCSSTQFCGSVA